MAKFPTWIYPFVMMVIAMVTLSLLILQYIENKQSKEIVADNLKNEISANIQFISYLKDNEINFKTTEAFTSRIFEYDSLQKYLNLEINKTNRFFINIVLTNIKSANSQIDDINKLGPYYGSLESYHKLKSEGIVQLIESCKTIEPQLLNINSTLY